MDDKLFHVLEIFKPFRFHDIGGHTLPVHCYKRPYSALNSHTLATTRNGRTETSPTYPSSEFPLQDLCRRFHITGQKWTGLSVVGDCLEEEISSHSAATNKLYSNTIYRHGQMPNIATQSKQQTVRRFNARFKHGNVDIGDTSIISMFSFSGPTIDTLNLRKNSRENLDSKTDKRASLALNKNIKELDWTTHGSTSKPSCEREMREINTEINAHNVISLMDQNPVSPDENSKTLNKKVRESSDVIVNIFDGISVMKSRNRGTDCDNVEVADATAYTVKPDILLVRTMK